jgi:peptidoglycan-N-acetylglucosamine deacetylase
MREHENKQIFFDRTKRRKRFLFFFFALTAVSLIFCFSVTISSFFRNEPVSERPANNRLSLEKAQARSPEKSAGNLLAEQSVFASTFSMPSLGAPDGLPGSTQANSHKNYAYFVNWDTESKISLEQNIQNIDGLIPEWLHLGENGDINVDDQETQDEVGEFIKSNRPDLPIFVLVNNFDSQTQSWDSQRLSLMLRNENLRNSNIENLYQYVAGNGYSGISIDYENIDPLLQPLFAVYLKGIYERFHPAGLNVSVNIPLEDVDYNPAVLSKYCDEIILMAYDQHVPPETIAGPVSSMDWYENSLRIRFLQAPPEKYIISLGNYGYDWASDGTFQTINFQQAMETAKKNQARINLDAASFNPNFGYVEGDVQHQIWYLDAISLFNQINAAYKYGSPGGIALWRMGSEDPSLWNFFGNNSALDENMTALLRRFISTYGVANDGQGEILKLTDDEMAGSRELNFDPDTKMITGEKISSFPSAFRIQRFGENDSKKIALTFDDGPDPAYTPEILDILKKYNAKGSFFVIGLNAQSNPGILKRIYREGHDVGIHTFTHPEISTISDNQYQVELSATERLIESELGVSTKLFRPPYLENSEPDDPADIRVIRTSSKLGYYTVNLGIDPEDWNNSDATQISDEVVNGVVGGRGNIILLHDSGGERNSTAKALPQIIWNLENKGFQFVTVSELMSLPRSDTMAPLLPSESRTAKINLVSFSLFAFILKVIGILFYITVILASIRVIFIAILAEIQIKGKRRLEKKWAKNRPLDDFKVSVIIPAYNEEKVIVKTINSLFQSVRNGFDIIVVNDASEDGTAVVVEKEFGNNSRVKLFSIEKSGKSGALNFGISKSDADIIITLDADTIFRWDTIKRLVPRFNDPRVGAAAGNVLVGNQKNLMTRWQALEYITNQNFDRRTFELVNAITVVPGSVGAWRKKAIIEAGGFSSSTLAEDADLTFSIIRNGYKVVYEENAVAYTESPETVGSFLNQRFRWMYGTLQAAWKNLDLLFSGKFNGLTLIAIPNVIIFQVLFALISPLMDLALLFSVVWAIWQKNFHPNDFSAIFSVKQILIFYLYFTLIDFLVAIFAFLTEKNKKWRLIWLLPLQRFFYRQLLYIVSVRSVLTALSGKLVQWGKLERNNSVEEELAMPAGFD